jgi:hypothetical protein
MGLTEIIIIIILFFSLIYFIYEKKKTYSEFVFLEKELIESFIKKTNDLLNKEGRFHLQISLFKPDLSTDTSYTFSEFKHVNSHKDVKFTHSVKCTDLVTIDVLDKKIDNKSQIINQIHFMKFLIIKLFDENIVCFKCLFNHESKNSKILPSQINAKWRYQYRIGTCALGHRIYNQILEQYEPIDFYFNGEKVIQGKEIKNYKQNWFNFVREQEKFINSTGLVYNEIKEYLEHQSKCLINTLDEYKSKKLKK